jgi:predicted site-specific integrase-resolvase
MLPLGFFILSMDIAIVRRWRRRGQVRYSRWQARRRALRASTALTPGRVSRWPFC